MIEEIFVGRVDAQGRFRGDHRRPDIGGGAAAAGDPVPVQQDQFGECLEEELFVDLGHAETFRRDVHPPDVVHGPEKEDGPVFAAVGLQPLEDLLGIVEDHRRGIQLERPVGFDQGIVPALARVVRHGEQMIAEDLSEAQLRLIGGLCLPLFGRGLNDFDIHCLLLKRAPGACVLSWSISLNETAIK